MADEKERSKWECLSLFTINSVVSFVPLSSLNKYYGNKNDKAVFKIVN